MWEIKNTLDFQGAFAWMKGGKEQDPFNDSCPSKLSEFMSHLEDKGR